MNKDNIKKEFMEELKLFHLLSQRDLKKGFTIEQVENELNICSESFYGSRLDFDEFALQKCNFIKTYLYQIVKGNFEDEYLDEFYNEIKDKDRGR